MFVFLSIRISPLHFFITVTLEFVLGRDGFKQTHYDQAEWLRLFGETKEQYNKKRKEELRATRAKESREKTAVALKVEPEPPKVAVTEKEELESKKKELEGQLKAISKLNVSEVDKEMLASGVREEMDEIDSRLHSLALNTPEKKQPEPQNPLHDSAPTATLTGSPTRPDRRGLYSRERTRLSLPPMDPELIKVAQAKMKESEHQEDGP